VGGQRPLNLHLVDGTYELFRQFFGQPSHRNQAGVEVAAIRGVLSSTLALLAEGATHVGVATDHVIESFRNDLWPGYKTSAGVPDELLSQFGPVEEALSALGVVVWPMVELEADDALASAVAVAAPDPAVGQVIICTPDKDLGQCVAEGRVVQLDRRKGAVIDEQAVRQRYGVAPSSIPDWLALVGDSADGFPGLPGWGPKSASTVLGRYGHLEAIPEDPRTWGLDVRGSQSLSATLVERRHDALLFRRLATLVVERSLLSGPDALQWRGPTPSFRATCEGLDAPQLASWAERLAAR
jgi:5'-3' exonuclease